VLLIDSNSLNSHLFQDLRGDDMPVKHDLFADLHLTREQVTERRAQDSKLNHLLDEYDDIDKQVLAAEAALAEDDDVRKLKEKRLLVKDKIVRQLEQQN